MSGVLHGILIASTSQQNNWNYATPDFLFHFDGNFTNSGTSGTLMQSLDASGISAADRKFGSHSLAFNGSRYFGTISNTTYTFTSSTVTAEVWFKTTNAAATYQVVMTTRMFGSFSPFIAYVDQGKIWLLASGINWSTPNASNVGGTVLSNTWHHLALCSNGSQFVAFLDGVPVVTFTGTMQTGTHYLLLGGNTDGVGQRFNGWMDEFRFISGVCMYPMDGSSFVPNPKSFTP